MKKKILAMLCMVIIIGVAYFINSLSYLKIEQSVEKIVIRNGNNGESIEITDNGEINTILNQINSLHLKRSNKISPQTGWTICLDIYFQNSMKSFTIRTNGIEYNNYFYGQNTDTEKMLINFKEKFN